MQSKERLVWLSRNKRYMPPILRAGDGSAPAALPSASPDPGVSRWFLLIPAQSHHWDCDASFQLCGLFDLQINEALAAKSCIFFLKTTLGFVHWQLTPALLARFHTACLFAPVSSSWRPQTDLQGVSQPVLVAGTAAVWLISETQ